MKSRGHSEAQKSVNYVRQSESINERVKGCGLKCQSYDWS